MKTPQTPTPQLATVLGLGAELYLKREDLHKYGSHKGRSIPLMMKEYRKQGIHDFVISSSGNAALAAIHAVKANNRNNPNSPIKLTIFVGMNIDKTKLGSLQTAADGLSRQRQGSRPEAGQTVSIEQVEKPKQTAFQIDKEGKAKSLRQSTDDLALDGYISLAEEINKIPNLHSVFVPTSSGTTAQALGIAFQELSQNPQIHLVQTEFCHPIAEEFDKTESKSNSSVASAIVDNVAHRKQAVLDLIKQSKGSGWIVSDEEIKDAVKLTKDSADIGISPNSALSIAGVKKAVDEGWKFEGTVVCLITGK